MDKSSDIELRLLIEAIYLKYSYDFRDYSGASVKRRVAHALRQFDCATISALQERVLHDPAAFMQLLQFLTIPVSEMFRDPSHFLAIRQEVVPLLKTYPSIKIWIAAWRTCAPTPPIISRPAGNVHLPTTTQRLTITRSSTRHCART